MATCFHFSVLFLRRNRHTASPITEGKKRSGPMRGLEVVSQGNSFLRWLEVVRGVEILFSNELQKNLWWFSKRRLYYSRFCISHLSLSQRFFCLNDKGEMYNFRNQFTHGLKYELYVFKEFSDYSFNVVCLSASFAPYVHWHKLLFKTFNL